MTFFSSSQPEFIEQPGNQCHLILAYPVVREQCRVVDVALPVGVPYTALPWC